MKNINYKNLFLIFIISALLIFLVQSKIIYEFIWGVGYLFGDYTVLISWLECNYLGFDVYDENSTKNCPNFYTIFFYGHMWLSLPFNEMLKIIYLDYVPYLTIVLFVIAITIIIKPKSSIEHLILILTIFNPSTMLLIERMGFDIFIFLITIFLAFNRLYIINWFLIYCLTFIKIYPVILGINIFLENKNRSLKKNLTIISIIVLISFLYFFIHLDEYLILLFDGGVKAGKAGYHYLFSLNTLPKIFKYILNINYILLIFIFYSSFIFLTKLFYKKFNKYYSEITKDFFSFNGRLYMLGGYVSLVCYILFSNYIYREVFLILLLPYLINLHRKNDNNLFKMILYFVFLRYLFLYPYSYINIHDGIMHIDGIRQFSNKFLLAISVKGVFDFILMSLFTSILFLNTKEFLKNKLNKK